MTLGRLATRRIESRELVEYIDVELSGLAGTVASRDVMDGSINIVFIRLVLYFQDFLN